MNLDYETINRCLIKHDIKLKTIEIKYDSETNIDLDNVKISCMKNNINKVAILNGQLSFFINDFWICIDKKGKIIIMYDSDKLINTYNVISQVFDIGQLKTANRDKITVMVHDAYSKLSYPNNINYIKLNYLIKSISGCYVCLELDNKFEICNNHDHRVHYLSSLDLTVSPSSAIIRNDGSIIISSPLNNFISIYEHVSSCGQIHHTLWNLKQTSLLIELISVIIKMIIYNI